MHLKKITFLLISFLFIQHSYSQAQSITGKIISGNEPVPYVTIGIRGKNIGTVADEHGHFKLIFKKDEILSGKEEIVFSCVGYADVIMPFKSLNSDEPLVIPLLRTETALNEVTVAPVKFKKRKFGKTASALLTSRAIFIRGEEINDALGREIGMILKIKEDCWLKDFNVFITGSQFKSVKFRLLFYDVDGEIPVLIPVSKDIIFDIDVRKGWVTVDLKPYHIFITGKEKIGVTMQWIKSEPLNEKSKYFVISGGTSLSEKGLYRPKSESPWTYPKQNLSLFLTADSY